MNFITPIGDFIRKGGDTMLGDLILEDSRLIIVRDQAIPLDPNIIIRSKTIAGDFLSMEFQNDLGVGVSIFSSTINGYMFISPNNNYGLTIPSNTYGVNIEFFHFITGVNLLAKRWWLLHSLMYS